MVPHAGYPYSGRVAAQTIAAVRVPRSVLLLGPNHTGLGQPSALWPEGDWDLPGGRVPLDEPLTRALLAATECEADTAAHLREHCLEVQLPLLRAAQPDLHIAALCLGSLSLARCLSLGRSLGQALARLEPDERPLLVASTDMSHYISARAAARADELALGHVLSLDAEGLYHRVVEERLSMCGFVPTTVVLAALRQLGASSARLIAYTHSGAVTGDDTSVVGYAGVAFLP